MKKRFAYRFLSVLFIIAVSVSSAGCQNTAVPEDDGPEIVQGHMVITDIPSSKTEQPYAPESPPINTEKPVSREDGNPSQDAVQSASQEPGGKNGTSGEAGSNPQVTSSSGSTEASSVPALPESEAAKEVSSSSAAPSSSQPEKSLPASTPKPSGEVRAVWISYLDLATMMADKTKAGFTSNIQNAFDDISNFGLNTVFVHVRPFGDALYKSDYFPWSYLITGTEGKDPGYDPLAIMVAEARKRGLRIEAWINPYRVRPANNNNALASDNQAKIWLDRGDDSAISFDGIISYNPGSEKARELIINGVRELVSNYGVDGVHIDDYFYPSQSGNFDKTTYDAYKKNGGKLGLADWRRENAATLIKGIYAAVKEINPDVLFGVSPQSSVYNNYNAQYLDVERILSEPGYCDYICPQVYFGYKNGTQPFEETITAWDKMIKTNGITLYAGLATYKIGVEDTWAGKGSKEWQENDDLMRRMVETSRGLDNYGGFALYRYDSLFNPASGVKNQVAREAANLQKVIN